MNGCRQQARERRETKQNKKQNKKLNKTKEKDFQITKTQPLSRVS